MNNNMNNNMNNTSLLYKSYKRGIEGGKAGGVAMGIQVCSLMWLRTTVNYQYKNGTNFRETIKILYNQGGIPRFYRGLTPALIQAPLSRFGDTAMNTGVMYYLNHNESTQNIPIIFKTFIGSFMAGLWRINTMPIDTCKTMMQVHGKSGMKILRNKIKTSGPQVLYSGSLGAFSATLMGHFPWFFTFNLLNDNIPHYDDNNILKYVRYGSIGFCSSFIADTVSNSARVIKTSKQTSKEHNNYKQIVKKIIETEGINGLLFRGLKTKIITNGVQGLLFTILWKYFENK